MSSDSRAQKSVQSPIANIIGGECVLPRATRTDGLSEDPQMAEHLTHCQEPRRLSVTVHNLPDLALLDIFGFYHDGSDEWHTLVHVCQRWRRLVFGSPRRLNLRLLCSRRRPVRASLDIWPALPIVIEDDYMEIWEGGLDNIIAALEHPDRVCSIDLTDFSSSLVWETLAEALLVPFPELTRLVLTHMLLSPDHAPVLHDSFLGGSAPHLQTLHLRDILFPALPNLLLSAGDLVHLSLTRLPHSGFISAESMVACLSSLNKLQTLSLGFQRLWGVPPQSPQSRPPPQACVVLPALTDLTFEGTHDYSEDLLARIDTPILNQFSVSFFLGTVFDVLYVPHFKQFIDRANELNPPKVARVWFDPWSTSLELSQQDDVLETRCHRIDWQVDSIALVCGDPLPFCSSIERCNLIAYQSPSETGEDDTVSTQFLELFRRFTAIQSLRVSECIVPLVATALLDIIGETATEALPNLRDLFLGGSTIPEAGQEAIQQFLTARQLSGQPVAIHHHHWRSEEFE